MDPVCVSARNCQPNDIQWEDEGPDFDVSLYRGWMEMNIDNRDWPCLQVCTAVNMIVFNKHVPVHILYYREVKIFD